MLIRSFILCISLVFGIYTLAAREPERKNTALFYKITATWCAPCGAWGWEVANEVQENRANDQLYMAIFNSSQADMNNRAFYNSTAVTLGFNFRHSSWPSFGVNGINLTDKYQVNGLDISGLKQECYDSIDAFVQREVVVNAASQLALEQEELRVKTNVRFFEKAVGTYYLASYIIEDGAVNYQNQQSGRVAHKGVLRGTLDSLDWGRLMVADSVEQDALFSYDYSFSLEGKDWDSQKLVIYNIIWKKEGSRYRYINGSKTRLVPATNISRTGAVSGFRMYPNPCRDRLFVRDLPPGAPSLQYTITDLSGRVVQRGAWLRDMDVLDISRLSRGLYVLSFSGMSGGRLVQNFVKY